MKCALTIEATDTEIREFATDIARRTLVDGAMSLGKAFNKSALGRVDPNAINSVLEPFLKKVARAVMDDESKPKTCNGCVKCKQPQAPPAHAPAPREHKPEETAVHETCFVIEETRHNEAAWGCCGCTATNNFVRDNCRICGHARCGIPVITPPPKAG